MPVFLPSSDTRSWRTIIKARLAEVVKEKRQLTRIDLWNTVKANLYVVPSAFPSFPAVNAWFINARKKYSAPTVIDPPQKMVTDNTYKFLHNKNRIYSYIQGVYGNRDKPHYLLDIAHESTTKMYQLIHELMFTYLDVKRDMYESGLDKQLKNLKEKILSDGYSFESLPAVPEFHRRFRMEIGKRLGSERYMNYVTSRENSNENVSRRELDTLERSRHAYTQMIRRTHTLIMGLNNKEDFDFHIIESTPFNYTAVSKRPIILNNGDDEIQCSDGKKNPYDVGVNMWLGHMVIDFNHSCISAVRMGGHWALQERVKSADLYNVGIHPHAHSPSISIDYNEEIYQLGGHVLGHTCMGNVRKSFNKGVMHPNENSKEECYPTNPYRPYLLRPCHLFNAVAKTIELVGEEDVVLEGDFDWLTRFYSPTTLLNSLRGIYSTYTANDVYNHILVIDLATSMRSILEFPSKFKSKVTRYGEGDKSFCLLPAPHLYFTPTTRYTKELSLIHI